ncbi:hypothetical protein E2C01_083180 [Portunus trituberculatus]|uniref:Uncharacterized protein n=1 Tax=Portunus trituberculatus TaxID=210409 RepID=A0A5B7IUF7_PORTR|nr:hypothetical protein [Portunus trituberculatus]
MEPLLKLRKRTELWKILLPRRMKPLLKPLSTGTKRTAPAGNPGRGQGLACESLPWSNSGTQRALRPSQRPNLPTRTSPRVCRLGPGPNQCLLLSSLPQITSPRVCRPAPGPNQCLLLSSLPQITSPRVRQPARGPSQCLSRYILRPSLPLIASPRVCRLILGPSESSHRPQYSHRSRRPGPASVCAGPHASAVWVPFCRGGPGIG